MKANISIWLIVLSIMAVPTVLALPTANSLNNATFRTLDKDERPAIIFEDVRNYQLSNAPTPVISSGL